MLVAEGFRADRRTPRRAARTVAAAVHGRVARAGHQVELAVHEAVANAVLHGGAPVEVRAWVHAGGVVVTVTDPGPAVPAAPTDARPTEEAGRGQRLIAASCDGWTQEPAGAGTRTRLWFAGAAQS